MANENRDTGALPDHPTTLSDVSPNDVLTTPPSKRRKRNTAETGADNADNSDARSDVCVISSARSEHPSVVDLTSGKKKKPSASKKIAPKSTDDAKDDEPKVIGVKSFDTWLEENAKNAIDVDKEDGNDDGVVPNTDVKNESDAQISVAKSQAEKKTDDRLYRLIVDHRKLLRNYATLESEAVSDFRLSKIFFRFAVYVIICTRNLTLQNELRHKVTSLECKVADQDKTLTQHMVILKIIKSENSKIGTLCTALLRTRK